MIDLEDLKSHLDDQTAVFMVTNPNTLGLSRKTFRQIAQMVHDVGGLVYMMVPT